MTSLYLTPRTPRKRPRSTSTPLPGEPSGPEMSKDPDLLDHRTWLGYVQKVGLVVSAPALVAAQAYPNTAGVIPAQQALLALFPRAAEDPARFSRDLARRWDADESVVLPSLPAFLHDVLEWQPGDLAGAPGGPELPGALDVVLPEYDGDRISPTYAVPDPDVPGSWLMLLRVEAPGTDLDALLDRPAGDHRWNGSPEARFERLLRDNDVAIGLLFNGSVLRLVYAPRKESSGHLTFPFKAMCEVGGRPLLAALSMLLHAEVLFQGVKARRLPAILRESRKYQSEVSTKLAEQVLGALGELVRGFQAADEAAEGRLLGEALRDDPSHVYGGLLTTLMRLVFVLYAEDRDLLPPSAVYTQGYSLLGLFERLRADDGRHHDAMGQRYGAWAQLLTLFRMLHDGASHRSLRLPPRSGRLFDPDVYPFLEGRAHGTRRVEGEGLAPPKVADGVIHRVLEKLLYLDGERLSYRALGVEDIGSVYEGMMGYVLEVAAGPSIAVRPDHVVVDLQALLDRKPEERVKALAEVKCKLPKPDALKKAKTVDELLAALAAARRISPRTPAVLPPGSLVLQPTEERRRSGSHYTPATLTEPIVRTTLEPVLAALAEAAPRSTAAPQASRLRRPSRPPMAKPGPTPDQILGLKVADPAMGSGAFLVGACSFLADALERAWAEYGGMPVIPPDEEPVLHARRLVAQRCLYGVDKNKFAVDLAKLSLWLHTLAKDHPFTFLDHALRHGDSLVGLGREQIASFTWDLGAQKQVTTFRPAVQAAVEKALGLRRALHELGDSDDTKKKQELWRDADAALRDVRLLGDLALAAFFEGDSDKVRKRNLVEYADKARLVLAGQGDRSELLGVVEALRQGERPVPAFHWEVELPEVFGRENPGFDAFVGNPPFLGGKRISTSYGDRFKDWLANVHSGASSNADLVAHFFRRAFVLLRQGGFYGLIATNTIAQGDTRASGLGWIVSNGGVICAARKRVRWPSPGAVVIVSVVHVWKTVAGRAAADALRPTITLNGASVDRISAFLFHQGGDEDPARLRENAGKSFIGCFLRSMGFTFDDNSVEATPLDEMRRLIEASPGNAVRIMPYLGGDEVNSSPTHAHRRYAINFVGLSELEARRWPDLMAIVEEKVKPGRLRLSNSPVDRAHKQQWWRYANDRPELYSMIESLQRVLAIPRVSTHLSVVHLSPSIVFSDQLVVIPLSDDAAFGILQSRLHEVWSRFFASTLGDGLRYTPSDCFETFPFPIPFDPTEDPAIEAHRAALEAAGETYYEYRAALMVRNDQGLTATYNRFHDPEETDPEILQLRALHTAMDRAVLAAYGWADVPTDCTFLLDYEDEDEDDEAETGGKRRKKKPWRYRWPDEVRDDVLARLIDLNQKRAAEERRLGIAPQKKGKARREDEEDEV